LLPLFTLAAGALGLLAIRPRLPDPYRRTGRDGEQ
jgi:hypothetical protein